MINPCVPIEVRKTPEGWTVWTCGRGCGFGDTDKYNHFPDMIHPPPCPIRRNGLGDRLASLLARIGITKESWNQRPRVCGGFIAVWQVPAQPELCGCDARQQALNRAGFSWERKLNRIGDWLWHRWVWLKESVATTQAQTSEQPTLHESAECQAHSSES